MATTACTNSHWHTCVRLGLSLLFGLTLTIAVQAQTAIYRLHRETSSTVNVFQKTANPNAAVLAILKDVPNGEYIKEFDTQAGGTIAGTITRTSDSAPINGALVEALQAGVVEASAVSTSNGTYSMPNVIAGTYDVRVSAIGYQTKVQTNVTVTDNTTLTFNQNLDAIAAGDINYIYDEAGRLVSVVSPTETATYVYDAAGNLLSTTRTNTNLPSIVEFSPNSGAIGAPVTIYGTGFSATANQNTVKFNGVTATVTSATTTQIVTSVPTGATTGPITVNTPIGLATSSTPFTVIASAAPTITNFTPTIGVAGTGVTITGTNFETTAANNRVTFNNNTFAQLTSATATSIGATVPAGATSGRISVATPNGNAVSSADFFVPPSPYVTADVAVTGRMTYGESKTVALTTSGKIGLIVFDGNAGQRPSLKVNSSTITSYVVRINNPNGSTLASITANTSGGFLDAPLLPATGTYTILIDPDSTNTGSINFTLFNASDVTATITPGGAAVTVTTTVMGQNAVLTFNGTASQRVSLKLTGVTIGTSTCCSARVSILNPNGSVLLAPTLFGTVGTFIDTNTLPVSGVYTILVDPQGTDMGSATLTLYDVPADPSTSITPGGSAVTVTTTVPGQNAKATFSGTAGQRVSLRMASVTIGTSTCCSARVSILKPDGTALVSPTLVGTSGGFIDVQTLPAAGQYTIVVDPQSSDTGSMTLTLFDVPADVTNTITPGGSPVTVTTTISGQNALVTFNGTASQRISLKLTGVTIGTSTCCSARVSIRNPDGTNLVSPTLVGTSGSFIDVKTLPATGQYTIVIDPQNTDVGSVTLTLYDVPADPTSSITPGGSAVTVTTTVPGQNANSTFNGTAGQRIGLRMTSVTIGTSTCCSARVSIRNPDGTNLVSPTLVGTSGGFIDVKTLAATGQYTIVVDPQDADIGSMTLTLYDVPADPTSSITPGGSAVTVTTTVPGQNANSTFNGTVGQRISLRMTSVTIGTSTCCSARVSIRNPDGTNLVSSTLVGTSGGFIDVKTLAATGQYTIVVDPQDADIGSMTLTLYDVPADATGTVTIGGAAVNVATTVPGQNGSLTFSGTSGQQVTIHVTSNTMGFVRVSLLKPDGTTLTSSFTSSTSFNLTTQTLSVTGTYTIKIDPDSSNTGSMNVNVTNP